MEPIYIVGTAVGVLLLIIIAMYNTLIRKKNMVENSFATIDVMLKKRGDLIPQLIGAVKGYMKHEKETLENLTALRSQVSNHNLGTEERVQLENKITSTLGNVMIAVENYPDLKASDNMMQLQRSINEMEEQLSASRRSFNAAVTDLNNSIESFPSSIIAGMMSMKRRSVFEIPTEQRATMEKRPDIKL